MLTLQTNEAQVRELVKVLGKDAPKMLAREIIIAVNATAKKTRTTMNREVRTELAVTAGSINKVLKIKRASKSRLGATVTLEKEDRLPLKDFKPRQTRAGVSYRISKRGGRKTAPDAFMGPRPGVIASKLRGHVYKRRGRARKPINMLHGASPWGVFMKRRLRIPTIADGEKELHKQLSKRIRFQQLKRTGQI